MKFNTKKSLFALSMLLILFISISMVSASDIIADDYASDLSDASISVSDASNLASVSNDASVDDVSLADTKSSLKLADSSLSGESTNSSDKLETKINVFHEDYCVGNSTEFSFNLVADDTYLSDSIDIYLNEKFYSSVKSSVDYDVDVNITGLNEGSNTVNLIYLGNNQYTTSIASFNIDSYSKSSVITYEMDKKVLSGEELIIRSYLQDGEGKILAGNILVNVSDEDGNIIKNASVYLMGTVTVPASSLTAKKNYKVDFYYAGNDEYAPSKEVSYFTVESELETSIEVNHPDYAISNSTTIYLSLFDENGKIINETVDVYVNGNLSTSILSDEEYLAVDIAELNLGENDILVKYNGSKFYKESEYNFNLTNYDVKTVINIDAPNIVVGKDTTVSINLTDENGSIVDGEFTVTVSEDYNGDDESYVPLEENYTFTGNGTIAFDSSKLTEGSNYNVYAEYKGNLTYSPSSEFNTFSVVTRDTEIELNALYYTDKENAIVNVSLLNKACEKIAGNVDLVLYDNESNVLYNSTVSTVADDLVSVDLGKLNAGHYVIYAKFDANHFYTGSELESYLHVFKDSEIIIETSDVIVGNSETVNFTLTHSDGALLNESIYVTVFDFTNKKMLYDDSLNLTDGKASITLENITEDLIIQAIYETDLAMDGPFKTEYIGCSNYAIVNAVEKTSPDAAIDLEANGSSIIAALKDLEGNPIANAVLAIDANGEEYNLTTDADGKVSIPAITGNGTIKVKYTDDDNLSVSNEILLISNVKEKQATKIQFENMKTTTVASVDGRIGKYFKVNLTDASGNPIANKLVQIGFNGKIYNRTTNATGGVELQINLPREDLYTFAICFLGDEDYNGSFEVALINVTKQAPKLTASKKTFKASAKTKSLTATLKTAKGNVLKGKSLVFIINGKLYNAKTNSKGVATVAVSISAKGTYTCTINSIADNTFTATSTKITVKIT